MYSAQAEENKVVYLLREDEYRDYFEAAKAAIIYLDASLRVKNINREAERVFGLSRPQVLNRRADAVFGHFGDRFLKIFAVSEYDDFYATNAKLKVNEQVVFVHVDTLKLRDSQGEVFGVILIAQDISAVKATIKQIQTTQMLLSLGELAAGVAHHVRTPLTTISGYLQIMMKRLEDDRCSVGRDVLEMLLGEVSYINNVVKELILFAKPPISRQSGVNVNRLLEDALRLTFKEVGGEKVAVEKELAACLPPVAADASLLKQALMNVLQNALEAMPGQRTLTIRTWLNAELDMLVIAVGDSGGGVAPHVLPRVFEPFYSTKLDRMGLGLPTAHRIISEHGGFINISSQERLGTKVHVYLPLADERSRQLAVAHQQILNLQ